jgi:hypothetical protein
MARRTLMLLQFNLFPKLLQKKQTSLKWKRNSSKLLLKKRKTMKMMTQQKLEELLFLYPKKLIRRKMQPKKKRRKAWTPGLTLGRKNRLVILGLSSLPFLDFGVEIVAGNL